MKRFFAVFLFWKKNFLSVGGDRGADLFGPIWICLFYILLTGFMGNFAIYLVDTYGFEFMEQHYANIFGTVLIFTVAEIVFYPPILGCLGGKIEVEEVIICNIIGCVFNRLLFRLIPHSDYTLYVYIIGLVCQLHVFRRDYQRDLFI